MDLESNINDKELQILELEREIEAATERVKLGEDLASLNKDPRFINVIRNGYIGELATYLFEELTKPATMQAIPEENIRDGLNAIRSLKSYIGGYGVKGDIEYNAEKAEEIITDSNELLDKL